MAFSAAFEISVVMLIYGIISIFTSGDVSSVFVLNVLEYAGYNAESNSLGNVPMFTLFFFVVSIFIRLANSYFQIIFSVKQEYLISKSLLNSYVGKDLVWFTNNNSIDLLKNILSEVSIIIYSGLLPIMSIATNSILALFMFIALAYVDPIGTVIVVGVIFLFYLYVSLAFKPSLVKMGSQRFIDNELKFKTINDLFNSIKETKHYNLESFFVKKFKSAALSFCKNQSNSMALAMTPRFMIELIFFGSIITIFVFFANDRNSLEQFVPTISLYLVAGYRVLPAFQSIYSSFSQVQYVYQSSEKIYNDISNISSKKIEGGLNSFSGFKKITLESLSFSYNDGKQVLNNLNYDFYAGKSVSIVGRSGIGKSTFLDVILGLLETNSGRILVDGIEINNNNLLSFRKLISYVPQKSYMLDSSISKNIVFGLNENQIDFYLLKKSAQIACLDDFLDIDSIEDFEMKVGDSGSKLSGGQRQRIGIARAIYRKPEVIILDEGLNAVDQRLERKIIKNIINQGITFIQVSHSQTNNDLMDKIAELSNGELIERAD